jgi:hypothetical protein
MTDTNLFRRKATECRRLAAGNANDKAFWLGLVERWQAVESEIARRPVPGKCRSPPGRQCENLSAKG